jgi:hypothetical protein
MWEENLMGVIYLFLSLGIHEADNLRDLRLECRRHRLPQIARMRILIEGRHVQIYVERHFSTLHFRNETELALNALHGPNRQVSPPYVKPIVRSRISHIDLLARERSCKHVKNTLILPSSDFMTSRLLSHSGIDSVIV